MHIAKDTTDTLIVRGYRWHRYAAPILFVLLAPLLVLFAILSEAPTGERLLIIAAAAFALFQAFLWVRNFHKNWELIFEAEFNLVGSYQNKSGTLGKDAKRFDLRDVTSAGILENRYPLENETTAQTNMGTNYLVLNIASEPDPVIVAAGDEDEIQKVRRRINDWLKTYQRHKQPQQPFGDT